MKKVFTLMVGLSLTTAATLLGDDWPQWNGPNRDGKSADTGLLAKWPEGGPKLVWKITGVGKGYSQVSVVGDRIYTMGDKEDAGDVLAFNAADGKLLWSTKVGKPGSPFMPGYDFPGPRCTPTVDGNLIFAVDAWGELVCVSASDGKEQWRKDYEKDFGGTPPTWGFCESPLVDGNQVVITPGGSKGTLVALNKQNGALLWQSKDFTEPAQYSSVISADIAGTHQYIQLTGANLVGIAAQDGSVLWKTIRRGNIAVIPTPVLVGDEIYATSGYNSGCNLFRVTKADGNFTAQQVYANRVMSNQHGGVVRVGDCIYGYADSKGLTCQNAKTGDAIWVEKEKIGKCAVTFADGKLYCREEDSGAVVLVDASPSKYTELGRFKQPDRARENAWTHPVVANGRLFLRDQDLLLCYDVEKGG